MLTSLNEYLQSTLGISAIEILQQNDSLLPFALQQYYHVYVAKILKYEIVFLYSYSENPASPVQIEKHLHAAEKYTNKKVCLVFDTITPYMRKKLIERQIPFVVPNKQMFIPFLAIHLQEHFILAHSNQARISPSMQALILYALVNKQFVWNIHEAAKELDYSFASMNRAFENLIRLNLCKKEYRSAQTRRIQTFTFFENLWDLALPYLKSPVEKKVFVRNHHISIDQTFYAGLTALSHYSMLAEEPASTMAISPLDWQKLKHSSTLELVPFADQDTVILEIWSYSPGLLTQSKYVDTRSLYLSLRDNFDERINSELERLKREW